jgi:hypothetical protein
MLSLRSVHTLPISQTKGGGTARSSPIVFAGTVATAAFFIESDHDLGALPLRGCIIAEPDRSKGPIRTGGLW